MSKVLKPSEFKAQKDVSNAIQPIQSAKAHAAARKDLAARQAKEKLKRQFKAHIDAGELDKAKDLAGKISKSKVANKSFSTIAKKIAGRIPMLGGVIAALSSGDVSAAVPILGDIEGAGPKKGSLEAKLESGEPLSSEEKKKLQAQQVRNWQNSKKKR